MPFKNFKMWRGRLPHWRADDVCYYATFRHRRPLDEAERNQLFRRLLRPEGKKWDLIILCILPEVTEIIFRVMERSDGVPYELSEIIEAAKRKAGNTIIKNTGEKYPPFYTESYDRIIRDEQEFDSTWETIFESPVTAELVESAEEYEHLWVANAPA